MKLKVTADLTSDKTVGFVTIEDLGNAQQATFTVRKIAEIGSLLKTLERLGYDKVTITVEKDHPMIIGGKTQGIAIACMEGNNE